MSGIGGLLIFFKLLIVVIVIFFAYITARLVGSKYMKTLKGKNISVVESMSIGFDKMLYIVKVGEQYFLLSSSGKNINFLSEINPSNINNIGSEQTRQVSNGNILNVSNFAKYLDLFKDKLSKHQKTGENELDSSKDDNKTKHIEKNVEKIKAIFNSIKVSDKDGVE